MGRAELWFGLACQYAAGGFQSVREGRLRLGMGCRYAKYGLGWGRVVGWDQAGPVVARAVLDSSVAQVCAVP